MKIASSAGRSKDVRVYTVGFILSIILTLASYFLVSEHQLTGAPLLWAINALAFLQAWVQLDFFLHLRRESQPRWKFIVFLFMLLVLAILVLGSLWIMSQLQYNVMPSADFIKQSY